MKNLFSELDYESALRKLTEVGSSSLSISLGSSTLNGLVGDMVETNHINRIDIK